MEVGFKFIDDYLARFMEAVHAAHDPLGTIGGDIMQMLLWISMFIAGLVVLAGSPAENIGKAMIWTVKYWTIGLIASNWMTWLTGLMQSGIAIGAAGGGLGAESFTTVSNIFVTGYKLLDAIWLHREMLCVGWRSCMMNLGSILLYELAWLLIFAAFAIMTAHMIAAQVVFMYHGLVTLVMIGTSVVGPTAFMSERAIGGMVANVVHLIVLSLIMGIGFVMLEQIKLEEDVSMMAAWMTVFIAALQAYFVHKAKEVSNNVVNGSAAIGGNPLFGALASGIATALGAQRFGSEVVMPALNRAGQGMHNALYGTGNSGAVPLQATPGTGLGVSGSSRWSSSGGGGNGSSGGRWNMQPTPRQEAAAAALGADISGMTRGQASQALEAAGHPDPSRYRPGGGVRQPASVGGGGGSGGGAGSAAAAAPQPVTIGDHVSAARQSFREQGVVGLAGQGISRIRRARSP